MSTKFPPNLQKSIDAAVLHLWDKRMPEPDLAQLIGWLESEGWNDVVKGLIACYVYVSEVIEVLNDETLMEFTDITERKSIINSDRILFARRHIDSLISSSMDSFHSIPISSKKFPPAELCLTMYFHPQGGADFYDICICHSAEDFVEAVKGELIMDAKDLSDKEILDLWRK